MSYIVSSVNLFNTDQYIFIYDDSGKREIASTTIDNLAEVIVSSCYTYDIYNIHLYGNEGYLEGFIEDIQMYNVKNYNTKKINIEVN